MRKFESTGAFYTHVDEIIESLQEHELSTSADNIHTLLHRTAWTTSTELLGELRIAFYKVLQDDTGRLATTLREDIEQCIAVLEQSLNN
jgi:hypothetical protein